MIERTLLRAGRATAARAFLFLLALAMALGFAAGHCTAQVAFHPAVSSLTPSRFPEPRGVWVVFDPVVDPFVWTGVASTVDLEVREAHFLHPNGWAGQCRVRLMQVVVTNVNPTLFGWSSFHTWPASANGLQVETHSRVLGNQIVLPKAAGYGFDYDRYCTVAGQVYRRPTLVAVLLEVR